MIAFQIQHTLPKMIVWHQNTLPKWNIQLTITRRLRLTCRKTDCHLQYHVAMGGNVTEASPWTGRKKAFQRLSKHEHRSLRQTVTLYWEEEVSHPYQMARPEHPPKAKYFHPITVYIWSLIAGPAHPPKVKFQGNCQTVTTTSLTRTRKLTTLTLRAISSVTKTNRRQLRCQILKSSLAQKTIQFTLYQVQWLLTQ